MGAIKNKQRTHLGHIIDYIYDDAKFFLTSINSVWLHCLIKQMAKAPSLHADMIYGSWPP